MSNIPADLKYTESHEWVRTNDDGTLTVGISDFAQEQLGDLVFVETPEEGQAIDTGDSCAVVESVKSASDVYSPVPGEVVEGNAALADTPELVNQDPYGDGWLFTLRPSEEPEGLMDAEAYEAYVVAQSDS